MDNFLSGAAAGEHIAHERDETGKAVAGIDVVLLDRDMPSAEKGKQLSNKLMSDLIAKGRATPEARDALLARITPTADYNDIKDADLVVEAVFEDRKIKEDVIKKAEAVLAKNAIFGSNTSTLPITDIQAAAAHPERVVGMHFFSPVHKMPLVEVIYGAKTAPDVTATIFDLAKRWGKTPVVVKDAPGFLVNRILAPYIGEAVRALVEGTPMEAIDKAMRAFGMPLPDDLVRLEKELEAEFRSEERAAKKT